MSKTLVLIPSRLQASRLPGKPLLKIKNKSIINHVYEKALEADVGEAYVVTGDKEIYNEVMQGGGKCILTSKKHNTGTDRIYEGYQKIKNNKNNYILNIQGDEPLVDTQDIKNLVNKVSHNNLEMGTLACEIVDKKLMHNFNTVKVETKSKLDKKNFSIALNFLRSLKDYENKFIYHHIGIYMYKIEILKKIVFLKQTISEIELRLEQMRALENNISIKVVLANKIPIGIDTIEDYKKVKKLMEIKI